MKKMLRLQLSSEKCSFDRDSRLVVRELLIFKIGGWNVTLRPTVRDPVGRSEGDTFFSKTKFLLFIILFSITISIS